ncbi:MAG: glycosyltransferase [Gammaproteobacteria bacterium]|nr:glycosyltransferase [Gammaproteobacteria bacterium]
MKVSVIITNYNYARYLGRAIRSLLDQNYEKSDYEVIIVDDNSSDHSLEVLKSFGDLIRTIELETNVGLSEARNIGVRNARGQYVVFVDADDYVHSDLLWVQQQFLSYNHQFGAVSVDYVLVDESENHVERINAEQVPIACGIMFRLDSLVNIGLYDKKFRAHEERDLRIRFQERFEVYNIILPLYRYRRHESNLTNDQEKMSVYSQLLSDKHGLEKP